MAPRRVPTVPVRKAVSVLPVPVVSVRVRVAQAVLPVLVPVRHPVPLRRVRLRLAHLPPLRRQPVMPVAVRRKKVVPVVVTGMTAKKARA
ncbi:hypothetical protein D3C72_2253820 [compost metagenome]